MAKSKTSKALIEYATKLIDLTRRNRLLNFSKQRSKLDFVDAANDFFKKFFNSDDLSIEISYAELLDYEEKKLDYEKKIQELNSRKTLSDYEKLKKKEFVEKLEGLKDSENIICKPWGKKLHAILERFRLDTRRAYEEHGLQTLFLAAGMLRFNPPVTLSRHGSKNVIKEGEYEYNAPLILIPLKFSLLQRPKRVRIEIDYEQQEVRENPILDIFFKKKFGLDEGTVPQFNIEKDEYLDKFQPFIDALEKNLNESELSNFKIDKDIFISQFTFYGERMYRDIIENEELFLSNPIIRGVCGETFAEEEILDIGNGLDAIDSVINASNDFTVLEADSSQLEVLHQARAGNSLVVTGPPGTGKSQTIVNLIADFVARGKSVLFLCAKKVALEVVHQRLASLDLEYLALPLFVHNQNKKEFAKKLGAAMEERCRSGKQRSSKTRDVLLERDNARDELNEYARDLLRRQGELNISIWDVNGKVADLLSRNAKSVPLIDSFYETLNATDLSQRISLIDDFEQYWDTHLNRATNPWLRFNKKAAHASTKDTLKRILEELNKVLKEIKGELTPLSSLAQGDFVFKESKSIADYKVLIEKISSHISPDSINKLTKASVNEHLSKIAHEIDDLAKKYTNALGKLENKPETDGDVGMYIRDCSELQSLLNEIHNYADESVAEILNSSEDAKRICNFINRLDSEITIKESKNIEFLKALEWLSNADLYLEMPFWPKTAVKLSSISQIGQEIEAFVEYGITRDETIADLQNKSVAYADINYKNIIGIAKRFANKYRTIFRYLSTRYHKDVRQLNELIGGTTEYSHSELKEIVINLEKLHRINKKLHKSEKNRYLISLLGKDLNSIQNWKGLYEGIKNVELFMLKNNYREIPEWLLALMKSNWLSAKLSLSSFIDDAKVIDQMLRSDKKLSHSADTNLLEAGVKFQERIAVLERIEKLIDRHKFLDCLLNESNKRATVINEALLVYFQVVDEFNKLDWDFFIDTPKTIEEALESNNIFKQFLSELDKVDGSYPIKGTVKLNKLFSALKNCNYTALEKLGKRLAANLEEFAHYVDITDVQTKSLSDQMNEFNAFYEKIGILDDWVNYRRILDRCEKNNLSAYLDHAEYQSFSASELSLNYQLSIWNKWLEEAYELSPILYKSKIEQDNEKARFCKLDKRGALANIDFLRKTAGYCTSIDLDEQQIIRHQANRKRSHMPIRKMVKEVENTLMQLNPCWMMSPLALSIYLSIEDSASKFDVVIFDEASQLRTADALGGLARAKQAIVVGDPKQLPPTSFFSSTQQLDEVEDSDLIDVVEFESVLDKFNVLVQPQQNTMLKWHYRSKYESLIAFSNSNFYNNQLITFPYVTTKNYGLEFDYDADIYDRGGSRTNMGEARRVVKKCVEMAKKYPNKTVGVIAMSIQQEDAVRQALAEAFAKNDLSESIKRKLDENSEMQEGFFIKNLESVQGDERDIIIMSLGYGYDKGGTIKNIFGPLDRQGGERRLNVAITRAREKMVLVSSIKHTDIKGELKMVGPNLLRAYLKCAELFKKLGSKVFLEDIGVGLSDHREDTESPFEAAVKQALEVRGYKVHSQIGISGYRIDLGIVDPANPNNYILGVECDGATYHGTRSARERDRLRQEIIESRGWKIYRIWSTHWIKDSNTIINDIDELVNNLLAEAELENKRFSQ